MKRYLLFSIALALLFSMAWLGCGTDTGPVAPQEEPALEPAAKLTGLARAMEVQNRHTGTLMALPDVVGTATGLGAEGSPAILVLAEKAGVKGIPRSLEGFPVIVKVTGKIVALGKPDKPGKPPKDPPPEEPPADPTGRFDRSVPIGVSTGHPDITAGTIGCRVTNGSNVFALSNNHVYANENLAVIGDAVIQPGTYDGGASPADDIGTLFDFEPIDFNGGNNTIDAAIASSTPALLGNATPSDGYGTPQPDTVAAAVNMPVMKYGRTTGLTKGKVYALNATVDVGYDTGVARFVGQIIITPGTFSAGGDSGSLIVVDGKAKYKSQKGRPVGLLFAGSSQYTIANPIGAVLDRFGVTVDGQ